MDEEADTDLLQDYERRRAGNDDVHPFDPEEFLEVLQAMTADDPLVSNHALLRFTATHGRHLWLSVDDAPSEISRELSRVFQQYLHYPTVLDDVRQQALFAALDRPLGASVCAHFGMVAYIVQELQRVRRQETDDFYRSARSTYLLLLCNMLHSPRSRNAITEQFLATPLLDEVLQLVRSYNPRASTLVRRQRRRQRQRRRNWRRSFRPGRAFQVVAGGEEDRQPGPAQQQQQRQQPGEVQNGEQAQQQQQQRQQPGEEQNGEQAQQQQQQRQQPGEEQNGEQAQQQQQQQRQQLGEEEDGEQAQQQQQRQRRRRELGMQLHAMLVDGDSDTDADTDADADTDTGDETDTSNEEDEDDDDVPNGGDGDGDGDGDGGGGRAGNAIIDQWRAHISVQASQMAFLTLNWIGGCEVGTHYLIQHHLPMLTEAMERASFRVEIVLTLANLGSYLHDDLQGLRQLATCGMVPGLVNIVHQNQVRRGGVGALMGLLNMYVHLPPGHRLCLASHAEMGFPPSFHPLLKFSERVADPRNPAQGSLRQPRQHTHQERQQGGEQQQQPQPQQQQQQQQQQPSPSSPSEIAGSLPWHHPHFGLPARQQLPAYVVRERDIDLLLECLDCSIANEAHGNILWSPWHPCQAIAALARDRSTVPMLLRKRAHQRLIHVLRAPHTGRQAEPKYDERYAFKALRELVRASSHLQRNYLLMRLCRVALANARNREATEYARDIAEVLPMQHVALPCLARMCRRRIRHLYDQLLQRQPRPAHDLAGADEEMKVKQAKSSGMGSQQQQQQWQQQQQQGQGIAEGVLGRGRNGEQGGETDGGGGHGRGIMSGRIERGHVNGHSDSNSHSNSHSNSNAVWHGNGQAADHDDDDDDGGPDDGVGRGRIAFVGLGSASSSPSPSPSAGSDAEMEDQDNMCFVIDVWHREHLLPVPLLPEPADRTDVEGDHQMDEEEEVAQGEAEGQTGVLGHRSSAKREEVVRAGRKRLAAACEGEFDSSYDAYKTFVQALNAPSTMTSFLLYEDDP